MDAEIFAKLMSKIGAKQIDASNRVNQMEENVNVFEVAGNVAENIKYNRLTPSNKSYVITSCRGIDLYKFRNLFLALAHGKGIYLTGYMEAIVIASFNANVQSKWKIRIPIGIVSEAYHVSDVVLFEKEYLLDFEEFEGLLSEYGTYLTYLENKIVSDGNNAFEKYNNWRVSSEGQAYFKKFSDSLKYLIVDEGVKRNVK